MSTMKGSKTEEGRATESASTANHGDLAELLAAVMRHADIPTDLHTHIGDWLVSQPQEPIDSPDYIRRALGDADAPGEAGARDIVNNPARYDDETRHAVANALRDGDPDLAEYVRRAERGETILDLASPLADDAGAVAQLLEARAASLTPAEVRALCEDLAYRHGGDEEDAADFLAVLTAAVYRRETGDREGVLLAARAGFMPVIEAASSAVDSLILKRLEVWRG